jgi:NTP pyrophosphatase (non-canonical NTP hydrolase)
MSRVLEEYRDFVSERAKQMATTTEDLLHSAIGISGEGGEILDAVKKEWVYNKPIDTENLEEELGDVLFYVQMFCNILETNMEQLIRQNMEKLRKRYPDGYSDLAAQERKDKKENG